MKRTSTRTRTLARLFAFMVLLALLPIVAIAQSTDPPSSFPWIEVVTAIVAALEVAGVWLLTRVFSRLSPTIVTVLMVILPAIAQSLLQLSTGDNVEWWLGLVLGSTANLILTYLASNNIGLTYDSDAVRGHRTYLVGMPR